jgi:cellulose synthase (UDP-forming)
MDSEAAEEQPAPSAPIAVAARAHGDVYPATSGMWRLRAAGLAVLAAAALYVPWMLTSLSGTAPWVAYPFAVANVFSAVSLVMVILNGWYRKVPPARLVARGYEPRVAVVIPTCGEAVPMVLRTVASVMEQDWPHDKLTVIVSDDGHNPTLAAAIGRLDAIYHEPPPINAPGRDGAAKAGNLNSAVELIAAEHPDIRYLETRDADDEVGSTQFLRHAVGQLEADDRLAFVQTIKEAQVSAGDPFNNRESMFYRGQMLARNAADAVFPCGSGLVWRQAALHDIGGFPTWNLVEDVHSGVEALKRGWRGMYLPIVGAVSQHSPENMPNYYKQRGTWAIDTTRLVVWGRLRGLGIRQRLQFWEMLAFYLGGLTAFIYIPSIILSLLGYPPLAGTSEQYVAHLLPYALAVELWLLAANVPYNDRRRRQRRALAGLWWTRVMWTGMAPIYAMAVVRAIAGGPNRKPVYEVTRKEEDVRWHWRQTLPQTVVILGVVAVAVYSLAYGTAPGLGLLVGSLYWGGLQVLLLTSFVIRGWYGLGRPRPAYDPAARRLGTRRRTCRPAGICEVAVITTPSGNPVRVLSFGHGPS